MAYPVTLAFADSSMELSLGQNPGSERLAQALALAGLSPLEASADERDGRAAVGGSAAGLDPAALSQDVTHCLACLPPVAPAA